jgi:hypothetical protein
LLSKNKYSFRFPTIFAQAFTVGVFFIFFSFYIVINDKFFSNKWFIIISLIAFFSNSKVFWFYLPFIFLIIIIHKYNFLKRIKINNNLLKISFFLLITLLFIISFIYFFGEEINNLTGYIFTVMLNNPLAGRADNFVMNGILWNLHNRTFLGNGFTYNSLNINHFGTWDSSFYFYINFGGVIYVFLIYTILYWLLFKSFIIKKYRSIIIFIFFLNIFLSGIGTTTLNQERASDLFFILIGYYYLKRREEIN